VLAVVNSSLAWLDKCQSCMPRMSKGGFVNTFHKVLCQLADRDMTARVRMINHVTKGEMIAHGMMASQMKGPAATKQWYIELAEHSWLEALKAAILSLIDLRALGRMDFKVNFPAPLLSKMSVDCPEVAVQDGHSATMLKMVGSLLRSRATSMSWHTSSYPGVLAPLLASDLDVTVRSVQGVVKGTPVGNAAERCAAVMKRFKADVEAWEAAQAQVLPSALELADRCTLRGEFMRCCIHFAKESEWRVNPMLLEMVRTLFTSMLQTKMNEDANQKLRDHETRDNASKSMKHFKQWSIPVDHEVLKSYDRPEIKPAAALPVVRPEASLLFESIHDPAEEEALALKEAG
jgi:hypothetical protein